MMVANFPLLMICLQITFSITSAGADSQKIEITGDIKTLPPCCEAAVQYLCEKDLLKQDKITKIHVELDDCLLTCYANEEEQVWEETLPDGMPCADGATCQDEKCFCETCENIIAMRRK
uniref:Putative salivary secreted protein n=1 Tax=Ixodes ricinus TaxID=34613 RepID=A0A6B0UMG7_IXORI